MGDGPLHFHPWVRGIPRLWTWALRPSSRFCVKEILPGEWMQKVLDCQRKQCCPRLAKHTVTRVILSFRTTYLIALVTIKTKAQNRFNIHTDFWLVIRAITCQRYASPRCPLVYEWTDWDRINRIGKILLNFATVCYNCNYTSTHVWLYQLCWNDVHVDKR